MERGLDPLTTNLVVADASRTEKTICLAVSPSLKAYGISGRARLFEVVERVKEVNAERRRKAGCLSKKSFNANELAADPSREVDYLIAPPRMAKYIQISTQIYNVYLKYIAPEDIQYLNAHGTSTNVGDVNEVKAIKEVFGEHAGKLVVNSTKSMTGHLLGGAGGVESVFTIKALEEQVSPPTINVFEQDPECDIDCCPNEARRMEINYAMKNSFGFGGTNSTVIYKRWTE